MTALSPALYADLIGKPYVFEGRGPAEYDCLGLAMEIARRRGLVVPEFVSNSEELHRQLGQGGYLQELERLTAPEAGCLALMSSPHAAQAHLATMTDPYWMLHAAQSTGMVVRQRLNDTFWRRRVLGFYRLEASR